MTKDPDDEQAQAGQDAIDFVADLTWEPAAPSGKQPPGETPEQIAARHDFEASVDAETLSDKDRAEIARQADVSARHDFEAASDVEHFEQQQTKDQATKILNRGCGLPAVIAAVIALIAGAVVVANLASGDDDEKKDAVTAAAPSDGAPAQASDTAADLSAFAGHYVFVSGLDDPNGYDVFYAGGPGAYTITPQGGTATLDIGPDGTITGGSYHASINVSSPNSPCTAFTHDASVSSGSIALNGPGAIGLVEWTGTVTRACPNSRPTDPGGGRNGVGIVGDQLILCRFVEMPSPTTCTAGYPRIVATFRRA